MWLNKTEIYRNFLFYTTKLHLLPKKHLQYQQFISCQTLVSVMLMNFTFNCFNYDYNPTFTTSHHTPPPPPLRGGRVNESVSFFAVNVKVNEMKVGSRKPAPLVCDFQRCLTINLWPFFDLQDMTQSWPTQKAFGGNQTLFPNDAKLPSTHQKQSKFSLPHPMSGLLETFPRSFVVFWVASRPVSL